MKKKYQFLSLTPFFNAKPSINDTAKVSLLLFVPQLVMLFLTKSYSSFFIILVSVFASVTADFIDTCLKHTRFKLDFIVILQGLFIGLFIPQDYPPVVVFILVPIVLLLSKYISGGFAFSWINPAVISVLVLYFFRSNYFPKFLIPLEYLKDGNIFSNLLADGTFTVMPVDKAITSFLNRTVFKFTGLVLPEGYISLLWDNGSVIAGFRFNLLTLAATIILISFELIDWIVPVVFLAVYAFCVRIFGIVPFGNMYNAGDILLALCTSGTLVCAFFILPWAGTVPASIPGKIIYAFGAGIASFFINGCGTGHIGSMFVVLIVNIISPLIQLIEEWLYMTFFIKKQELLK
ncbi:MAG: RnfABCDGE type electron transport complex subunit D [Spirochaetaceae bacterium]|nr:RnfABCDGE type electron transport complex subunit D [Spirochaetaceae bacterium]